MTKEQLKAKVDLYTAEKAEIEKKDYSAEIEVELTVYKAELVAKHEAERKADLAKIDDYLTLLDELVAESEEEEAAAAEAENEEATPATPIVG